jgi:hypothetical protein
MFKLSWPDTPSPFWFGGGRQVHVGRVRDDGCVDAESNVLYVLEGEVPQPGTELRIQKDRFYLSAETVPEYETRLSREDPQRKTAACLQREEADRRYAERRIRDYEQACAANGKLNVPVRWTSGLKTVLSGLSSSSNGTGDNARSVRHILLLESLEEGRLLRPANTLLCTSAGGSNGQAWTDKLATHAVGPHGPYVGEITCSRCLKLAGRWTDAGRRVEPEVVES